MKTVIILAVSTALGALLVTSSYALDRALLVAAPNAESLLPSFGGAGRQFQITAQGGNSITGWLPADWSDNSDWAAVSATYKKLPEAEAPKPGLTAVRVELTKVEEGQLQLAVMKTIDFAKGQRYAVTGWIRSKDGANINVGIRQPGDPYEFYQQKLLTSEDEWKPFTFEFTMDELRQAFVMFTKPEPGVVDLAGIELVKKEAAR